MLVRTISQLPSAPDNYSNGVFEISVPQNNDASTSKYTSYSISQTTLSNGIRNAIEIGFSSKYGWKDGSSNINIKKLKDDITTLSSNNCSLMGIKTFMSWPSIPLNASTINSLNSSNYGNDLGHIVPNINAVKDLIGSQPVYFSTDDSTVAEGNPLNAHSHNEQTYESKSGDTATYKTATIPESLSYNTTIGNNKFYFWHIDDKDSSKAIYDTRSATIDRYEKMRDTGQLVVWGWLADNGNVSPEMAWVGLFAAIKREGDDNTQYDVPISIQPWIRGQHASTLQYISFNVPVKNGLELKIKTGFPVNSHTSGGFQNVGTLTFIDRYIPNSFFGYIIK